MPNIKTWEFEEFAFGEFYSQRIDFSIDDHHFFMIFTPVDLSDVEYITEREEWLGLSIPPHSYDVKFDRTENFENDSYYQAPAEGQFSPMGAGKMKRLGKAVCQLMEFHCTMTGAECYLASAESEGLRVFYDRLVSIYADQLEYKVTSGLGDEELDYVIKTSKSK